VDERGNKDLMIVFNPAISVLALEAMWTMDLLGVEILCAIQGNKVSPIEGSELKPSAGSLEDADQPSKSGHEPVWIDRIKKVSELGILWDGLDSKHTRQIARSMLILKTLLEREHSRILKEHHGKPSGYDINQGIINPLRISIIRHLPEDVPQDVNQGIKLQLFWSFAHELMTAHLGKEYKPRLNERGKRTKRRMRAAGRKSTEHDYRVLVSRSARRVEWPPLPDVAVQGGTATRHRRQEPTVPGFG